jgi:hypothetical protein
MHSYIREMLRNRKYVGNFSFGARRWQRHPITRKRVARASDDTEVLRAHRPELAIVDRATWDAVQVLLAEHAKQYKARAVPHGRTEYLLTGLAPVVDAVARSCRSAEAARTGTTVAWQIESAACARIA